MNIYSIGEISKISDIPIRTLRFYDQKGIFSPEFRNNETGYRYYSEKQIAQILIIKSLKHFGLPLKEIKNILNSNNEVPVLLDQLDNKINLIKVTINTLKQQLQALECLNNHFYKGRSFLFQNQKKFKGHKHQLFPIEIKKIPEISVISTRYTSQLNVDKLFFNRCLELQLIRDKYNLFHSGPIIGIFHNGYECQFNCEEGILELCMPVVKPKNISCEYIKKFGGFLTAGIIHIGHYRNSLDTYKYLVHWINKNQYTISGPPIEQYILDPCTLKNVNHYVTRISFPILHLVK